MASGDAKPVPVKNAAFRITFPLMDADGDLVTGATGLDSEVSKDGGSFTDCSNEATEIGSSGMYYLDVTSTEMNADTVAIIVKTSTSGAKTTPIVMYPQEAGDIAVDVQSISGDATAADRLEAYFDGTGAPVTITSFDVSGLTTYTGRVEMLAGMAISQSTLNTAGLSITGNGTSNGVVIQGGATGDGLRLLGGSSAGRGVYVTNTSGVAFEIDGAGGDLVTDITGALSALGSGGASLTDIPWNADWDTEVESEVSDALIAIHLDHLLAAAYDPSSKPGDAGGLLNVIFENDAGVPRFTANALEQGPSGGSGPSAADIADAVWDEDLTGHTTANTGGKYLGDNHTKLGYLPAATAGSAGGLFIAGSNAALTLASLTVSGTTTLTGNLSAAAGVTITQSTTNGNGLTITGNGTGNGIQTQGGATGHGFRLLGGGTSGYGMYVTTTIGHGIVVVPAGSQAAGMYLTAASNGHALRLEAAGTGTGLFAKGGASGPGAQFSGGSSSGDGLLINSTSGNGIYLNPTAGHGIYAQANGASKHGLYAVGGTSGTSDGIYAAAGSGGIDIRGAVAWNAAWDAEVQSEVQDALEVNHLDHLLAAAYDPASKPGNASGLLNVLFEDDAGVPRYTANALEQAPSGGSGPSAGDVAEAVWALAVTGNTDAGSFGELVNNAAGLIDTLDGYWQAGGAALDSIPWNAAWDAEVQSEVTDAIGNGSALTAIPWNSAWDAEVQSEVTDALGTGSTLTAIPWNAAWDVEVESEANDALVALHLDHLLAAAYDPASKPGNASGLLNVIFENDGGVPRYTANALEQSPAGSAPTAGQVADAVWDELTSGHAVSGSFAALFGTPSTTIAGDILSLYTEIDLVNAAVGGVYTLTETGLTDINTIVTGHTTYVERIPVSPASVGSAMTLANDAITAAKIADNAFSDEHFAVPSDPVGMAEGILSRIVQSHRRYFAKTSITPTALVTYADDGSTPLTTQSRSESSGIQTLGAAT